MDPAGSQLLALRLTDERTSTAVVDTGGRTQQATLAWCSDARNTAKYHNNKKVHSDKTVANASAF